MDYPVQFLIAPPSDIKLQFRKNLPYIAFIFLVLIVWCIVSAVIVNQCALYRPPSASRTYFDALYFTVINVTTVGFGDIYPLAAGGKIMAMLNALIGLLLFGCLIAVITAAFQPNGLTANGVVSLAGITVIENKGRRWPGSLPQHLISRILVAIADVLSGEIAECADDIESSERRRVSLRVRSEHEQGTIHVQANITFNERPLLK